nr:putative zinc finger, CCHC-type [Tanacetum cinerariifolium]
MKTRSKSANFKTKHIVDLASLTPYLLHIAPLSSITEPRCFKTASKDPKWMGIEELQALQQNKTWTLVPRPRRVDTSLFIYNDNSCVMYLLVYVDDLILTGNDEAAITSFISGLNREFAIKDLGAGLPFLEPTLHRSFVGALQYLTITRPDLSYAVNQVSQFLHAPTTDHYQSVKRILHYVKGTISFGFTFHRPIQYVILGYFDANWARCLDTRRSTYGYSIYLGGNLVSWSAKKQPTVSRSSCESEYRAMANTATEIIWFTHLLCELHALPPDRPTLLCDNKSALFTIQNPVSHKRAKHIDLDYHFIRELVKSGKLFTKFVPTNLQVADIFIESLSRSQFETFRSMLFLGPLPSRLKGVLTDNYCIYYN